MTTATTAITPLIVRITKRTDGGSVLKCVRADRRHTLSDHRCYLSHLRQPQLPQRQLCARFPP